MRWAGVAFVCGVIMLAACTEPSGERILERADSEPFIEVSGEVEVPRPPDAASDAEDAPADAEDAQDEGSDAADEADAPGGDDDAAGQ